MDTETENRMVLSRDGGEGCGSYQSCGCGVSLWDDEKVVEIESDDS